MKDVLEDLEIAVEAVWNGAQLAARVQRAMLEPDLRREHNGKKPLEEDRNNTQLAKQDTSPVTVGDFSVQALIGSVLSSALGNDPLVAEEDSGLLRTEEGKSLLDAIGRFLGEHISESTGGGDLLNELRRTFDQIGKPQNKDDALSEQILDWIDRGSGEPARRYWTLDPIDGTKGFLRGDQYVVALALIENGEPTIGVLGCPVLDGGSLVVAVRGEGTWRIRGPEFQVPGSRFQVSKFGIQPPGSGTDTTRALRDRFLEAGWEELRVSERADPSQARLLRSVVEEHTDVEQFERLVQDLGTNDKPVLMDSQAKYVLLASGEADLLFRLRSPDQPSYREKIWDHATGSLIVKEAGGRVTDLDGQRLDFSTGIKLEQNRGVLASNGLLHEAALERLARLHRG